MQRRISKLKAYSNLFTPSVVGLILYAFLAGLTIILNQFEAIQHFLQIPHNVELGRIFALWLDQFLSGAIGESRTQTLVVGLFWAVVGLVVYAFLRGLARLAVELDDDLSIQGYVWPKGTDRFLPLKLFLEQAAFRLVAIVGFVLLVFGPVAALLRGPVFVDFLGPDKTIQFIVWFVAGMLTWHALVILARLLVLRARLFD